MASSFLSSGSGPVSAPPSGLSTNMSSSETDELRSDSFSARDIVSTNTEHEGGVNDLISSEESSQLYMSLIWGSSELAVAYYDVETTEIYLMTDTVEQDDFKLLRTVMQQISPKFVVTSAKEDDRFVKVLQELTENAEEDSDRGEGRFCMLPSIDYSFDLCRRRLLTLELPGLAKNLTDSEKTLYLSSLVPLDQPNVVRALGGLLKFLDKKRVGVELEDLTVSVPVVALRIFSIEDMMIVDNDSYTALQIFQRESHPSVYKTGNWSGAKEGLSLYGILNRCKSQLGMRLLRLWLMRPSKNIELLNERLDAVEFFANARNIEVTSVLQNCLRNIKNVSKILVRMRDSQATPADWEAIYKTVYNAVQMVEICSSQTRNIAVFKQITELCYEDLKFIANFISKVVDLDESRIQNRFVVKPNVDPELDRKKRTFNGLPDFMTQVANDEMERLRERANISECNIVYLPQLGYLLTVPVTSELKEDNYQIPDLDLLFTSNNTCHYKSQKTKELDELLGDTQCEIADQEMGVMLHVQNTILERSKALLDLMIYAGQLDCLIALAFAAKENNYVRPKLTSSNVIQVKRSRHPLQELCCNPFVPNDISSGSQHGKVKVLTGPNASGKSVYIKQVALVVFMAQIGSFVPADAALIGVCDQIFTRIRTMESVLVGLSTYMIDINQMSHAMNNATERSVVIVDEFGKGTKINDGISLLSSCLSYWLEKEAKCPHVFVSTHFHSIKRPDILPRSPLLKFLTMEVLQDDEDLVLLYQLAEGSSCSSYACRIATLAGLSEDIVNRGEEITELLATGQSPSRSGAVNSEKCCREIADKFLSVDFGEEDVHSFLKLVLDTVKKYESD